MDGDPTSTVGHINRGILFHADGAIDSAKNQFARAVLKEPGNEVA